MLKMLCYLKEVSVNSRAIFHIRRSPSCSSAVVSV